MGFLAFVVINGLWNLCRSETDTEGSELIDLTRITYSPETMSDKDFHFDNNNLNNEATAKKSRFKGKNKIDIEFITTKSRRQSTFSKRKTGLMKKAYELAELTGAEVLLMIASDTNHVYTYGTTKMKPVFESEQGKLLIEACLNSSGVDVKNIDSVQSQNESSNHQDFFTAATLQNSQCNNSNNNSHIGQLVFNMDHSVCRGDSKIIFPIAISNGTSSSSAAATTTTTIPNGNLISSTMLFQSTNNQPNGKSDGAVLMPVSIDAIPAVLPKINWSLLRCFRCKIAYFQWWIYYYYQIKCERAKIIDFFVLENVLGFLIGFWNGDFLGFDVIAFSLVDMGVCV